MSNESKTGFFRKYDDQREEGSSNVAKGFNFSEVVDPKHFGKKKFTYDSDQAQNLDETNIKKAREGAKEILADSINKAKSKVVQIREEARKLGYEEGYRDGLKKGEDDAQEKFADLYHAFESHNRELSGFRRKMYGKVEREMIEMVVALSKKIIYHELATREDSIQQMIRLAVDSVLDKESMTIKIHPDDKGYAESFRPELHQLFDEIKNITFEASPALDRGGCIIETNFGTIDARLEHLSQQIDKILTLTPISFEEGQTQFPEKLQPEEKKAEPTEGQPTEETPEDEIEDDLGDSEDADDFDFPDLAEPDQET